jgi:hypothetical protein
MLVEELIEILKLEMYDIVVVVVVVWCDSDIF